MYVYNEATRNPSDNLNIIINEKEYIIYAHSKIVSDRNGQHRDHKD